MEALNMLEYIWTATQTFLASTIVLAGAWALGRIVLKILGAEANRLPLTVTCVIGVCVYGTTFTAMSLLGLAHPWSIVALGIAPIVMRFRDFRVWLDGKQIGFCPQFSNRGIIILLSAICLVYVLYVLILCLGNYYGADLLVYHLTIPRDILDNRGFAFNPYFLAAGLPLGWHHFGLLGWALGGERGYLALSFWAFVGVLSLSYSLLRKEGEPFPSISGLIGAAVTAYVVAGMSRGSVPNNDVPLMLLEATALLLALQKFDLGWVQRSVLIGLVTGFALSIKTQSLIFLPILCVAVVLGTGKRRLGSLLVFGAVMAPIALVWPLNTLLHTGSPFPLVTNALRLSGEPLPQLSESLAYSAQHYGLWLEANFGRFFTQGMIGFPLFLAGIPIAFLCIGSYRRNPLVLVLIGVAIARYGMLSLGTMDPQILYHDRYHMISYTSLGLAAILGWMRIGTEILALGVRDWIPKLTVVLSVLCAIQLTYPLTMWSPHRDSMTLFVREKHPSIVGEMKNVLLAPRKTNGTDPDSVWAFVDKNTPSASIIATTNVITYGYRRKFVSLLPNTQDRIDLRARPEELLDTLRKLGVNFLHLAPFSSQNGFMEPFFEKALISVRDIGQLPGVKLVYEKSLAPNIADRLYYVGVPGPDTKPDDVLRYVGERVVADGVENLAARRSGSTQIVLTWTRSPFADCEIQMSANGEIFRYVRVAKKCTGYYELDGVSPNVNYAFRIRKKWGNAASAWRATEVSQVRKGQGQSGH